MENASKALLIAGGILIVILLLTLFAYLVSSIKDSANALYVKVIDSNITTFNQQFLNYNERGTHVVSRDENNDPVYNPLTAQDVVTLINMVKDANANNDLGANIDVSFSSIDSFKGKNIETISESDLEAFLMSNLQNTYNCEVIIGGNASNKRLVSGINIMPHNP